jgi:hypothetical protein
VPVVDLTSDSGESQSELGCLLEASDDELGLLPSGNSLGKEVKNSETELGRDSSYSSGIGELRELHFFFFVFFFSFFFLNKKFN